MRRTFALIAAWLALAAPAAAFGPLIEVADLEARLAAADGSETALPGLPDLVIDIRNPRAFAAGHIPGAVNAPYARWRGPRENPGRVPSEADLEALLGGIGASPEMAVLIVHAGRNPTEFGAAARVYWTLKSAGFGQLAILNGGAEAWTVAGGTLETGEGVSRPLQVDVTLSREWWIDADGVADVVDGSSPAVLLDARPLAFFEGDRKHGAAAEAGTLAGALNIVHSTWFASGGPFMEAPAEMIARIQAIAAENADRPLVSFCNTGHWAATNWFAASELAGVEGAVRVLGRDRLNASNHLRRRLHEGTARGEPGRMDDVE
ncbi:MAG: rhodanese-like domain-containing protein, partial [Pseudomonadota bacterium]